MNHATSSLTCALHVSVCIEFSLPLSQRTLGLARGLKHGGRVMEGAVYNWVRLSEQPGSAQQLASLGLLSNLHWMDCSPGRLADRERSHKNQGVSSSCGKPGVLS